jgi:hypothetical protein
VFGLQLRPEWWVLLGALVYAVRRVGFAAGQVLARWAADGPLPRGRPAGVALVTGPPRRGER